MIYIAIDGDNTGEKIERHFISNDEEKLKMVSNEITRAIYSLSRFMKKSGFTIIFKAGDNLLFKGNECNIDELKKHLKINSSVSTFSAGIGNDIFTSYLSLRYAKTSGKNCIVQYISNSSFNIIPLL